MSERFMVECRLAPGEHRLFYTESKDGLRSWYLADDSGATPDRTDDGPIRVLPGGCLRVGRERCALEVEVCRDDSTATVGLTHQSARRLLEYVPSLRIKLELGAHLTGLVCDAFKQLMDVEGQSAL